MSIDSPAAGATVHHPSVRVTATPRLAPGSTARIDYVEACLVQTTEWGENTWPCASKSSWDTDLVSGRQLAFDLAPDAWMSGSFVLRVTVQDSAGRSASDERPVTLAES